MFAGAYDGFGLARQYAGRDLHNKTQWMSEAGIFQLTAIVDPL